MVKNQSTSDSNYFYVMFCLFLLIVFLGFAPSFYLKFLVTEQPYYPKGLPLPYIFHGVVLTIWYVFLVIQSGWIRFEKISIHRKMGWFGAFWAVFVVSSTLWVISIFPGRMEQLAADLGQTVDEVEPGLYFILWLDLFMSILFVAFAGLGIKNRNKPEIHKRLMLYSGLVFLFAATGRIGGILGYLLGMEIGLAVSVLLLFGLSVSLPVYDYRKKSSVMPVSWICFGLYWLATLLSFLIGNSEWGVALMVGVFG